MHGIPRALLVYDGTCDFCRYWVTRWRHVTGDRIDYAAYQEIAERFPQIPLSTFEASVQLILTNGTVLSGAAAVFRALDNRWLCWMYHNLPGFARVSEGCYYFVARHRPLFSALTRRLWKTDIHSEL